jgi:uncharacterized protein (DUF779 family)
MATTLNEREAFEKVFSDIWIGYSLDKNADGTYVYLHAANQYRLWQHQQQIIDDLLGQNKVLSTRIEDLEEKLCHYETSRETAALVIKDKNVLIESLQAKLDESDNRATKYAFENDVMALRLGKTERQLIVTVNALENIKSNIPFSDDMIQEATEALAEINRKGE